MKKIAEIIKHAEKISVISHKDPDGDAVGSQLGLALALEKEGKEVYSYNVGEVPEYLFFLPGSGTVKIYNGEDLSDSLVIFVDCADRNRPGIQLPEGITINIDHHVSNDNFAMYNYIDTKSASTGEIIYKLIREMGIELDKNIATCLYTAVSTDTGSFMYSNTTADTHLIAADLINNGADTDGLRENFFEGVSLKRFKLTKYAYQEVNFACDNLLAWIKIPYSILFFNAVEFICIALKFIHICLSTFTSRTLKPLMNFPSFLGNQFKLYTKNLPVKLLKEYECSGLPIWFMNNCSNK
jgi:phosphoesterase RecJ-like protein